MSEVGDRRRWGEGPWLAEPDVLRFEHAGLPCMMLRGDTGNWCGYAAVSPAHPWYRKHYDQVDDQVGVHGGLTFSGTKRGETEEVWWFGFDCAHAGDLVPGLRHSFKGDVYRDVTYVRANVERLAEQLAAVAAEKS